MVSTDDNEMGVNGTGEGGRLLMTPVIRLAITSTSSGLVGDLDLIKTAELCRTVSMALSPAKTMVWPDSVVEKGEVG